MKQIHYAGISNPSGAVALDSHKFIVADDEDNLLRIYDRGITAQPLQIIALKEVFKNDITDGEGMEIDLEGATLLNDTFFWIGSHSTDRKGNFCPARHRLLSMQIKPDSDGQFTASRTGSIYSRLIADLEHDKRFDKYHLSKAKTLPPDTMGGLSIEGLATTPENGLLIGFRNPLNGGKEKNGRLKKGQALLVPLLNPFEVISGQAASFGDPIELNLGGYGIRDIVLRKKHKYLIVAGPYHNNQVTGVHRYEKTKLYSWSGKSGKLKELKKIDLKDLNIESAFFYPDDNNHVQLLSDDGKSRSTNSFRSVRPKL
jgi:hypothetical protein